MMPAIYIPLYPVIAAGPTVTPPPPTIVNQAIQRAAFWAILAIIVLTP